MIHERFDISRWIESYPIQEMDLATDVNYAITGPLPISYIEQARRRVIKAGGDLGEPVAVDLFLWKSGESARPDVTKVGGVPYWPDSEPWPMFDDITPYTFLFQICFGDSKDLIKRLPGDILSVLCAKPDFQDIEFRWFKTGIKNLQSPKTLPSSEWKIQPCHGVLHRTAEYPFADYVLFDEYCYPLSSWATTFGAGTKIGGDWNPRGALPEPEEEDDFDPEIWKQIEKARKHEEWQLQAFVCQFGSLQATPRQPFVNVKHRGDLVGDFEKQCLMIFDVGGFDFFCQGQTTDYQLWSG